MITLEESISVSSSLVCPHAKAYWTRTSFFATIASCIICVAALHEMSVDELKFLDLITIVVFPSSICTMMGTIALHDSPIEWSIVRSQIQQTEDSLRDSPGRIS
jgi:hypothetical protein